MRRFTTSARPSGSTPSWPRLTTTSARSGPIEGGLDEAIAHYRQALRIDPEFARAEYMLGVALAGKGRLDEANDRDQRALRIDPADAKAHEEDPRSRGGRGDHPLQAGPRIDPKLTLSRNNLGLSPRDADRLNEAIGHYEKALRIEPGLFMAHAARWARRCWPWGDSARPRPRPAVASTGSPRIMSCDPTSSPSSGAASD